MKKFIILLIFLFWSTSAFAEWLNVATNRENRNEYYVDPESIKEEDGYFFVWTLQDYVGKSPFEEIKKPVSAISLFKVDCRMKKALLVQSHIYNAYMGKGKMIQSMDTPGRWRFYPPGSSMNIIIKYTCLHK